MRHLTRMVTALAAAGTLTALLASIALAGGGGHMSLTVIDRTDGGVVTGQAHTVRFTLLQNGTLPLEAGSAEVTAWHPSGGARVVAPATSVGGGEWVATLTLPVEGDWRMSVAHVAFPVSESFALAVAAPSALAWLPAALVVASSGLAAVAMLGAAMLLARTPRAQPATAMPRPAQVEPIG